MAHNLFSPAASQPQRLVRLDLPALLLLAALPGLGVYLEFGSGQPLMGLWVFLAALPPTLIGAALGARSCHRAGTASWRRTAVLLLSALAAWQVAVFVYAAIFIVLLLTGVIPFHISIC